MGQVGDTIGTIKTSTLAAIGAITGLAYSFGQLTKMSLNAGNTLANFQTLTGYSADFAQRYQFAGLGMVSAEETLSSMQRIQQIMTQMKNGQNPGFSEQFVNAMNLDTSHLDATKESDAKLFIQELQNASKKLNPGAFTFGLSQLGFGTGFETALKAGAYSEKNLSRAPTISEGGIKSLQNMYVKIEQLRWKIEKMFAAFTAKHGPAILAGLEPIITQVGRLVENMARLAESFKVFQGIASILKYFGDVLQYDNDLMDYFRNKKKGEKPSSPILGGISDFLNKDFMGEALQKIANPNNPFDAWKKGLPSKPKEGAQNNLEHNSNIHIHTDTKDPSGLANLTGKAVQQAFYQNASLLAVV